jgi:branched-chain amino acid transport system substrate-binding protein
MPYSLFGYLLLVVFAALTGGNRSALAEMVYRVGVATSQSTLEGAESIKAVALAVEEINRAGGLNINGQPLRLTLKTIDLQDAVPGITVDDILRKLERFIVDEKIRAVVVGPFRSEVLLPAMTIFARHRIILLETIAMTPAADALVLKDARYRYFFRTGLNTKYLADMLIGAMQFLQNRYHVNRVYLMSQDNAWARSTTSLMLKLYFERTGWQIVGIDHFAQNTADYSTALEKAASQGAQIIVPIFDIPDSAELVKQWKAMKIPAILCGFISPIAGPSAWKQFDGQIAGALNVIFELGNVPSDRHPPATAFYNAYAARYGHPIEAGHGPAPAYEAVYLLKTAIEAAGDMDPDKVVSALEQTDHAGAMGRLRFHRGHQIIFGRNPDEEAVACLIQWSRNGRRRIVYPPSLAEGDIESPFVSPSSSK